MGWTDDLEQFVIGRTTLTRAGVTNPVRFRGADDGSDHLADGFRAAGTPDGWRAMADVLRGYPTAWFVTCAAFTPPLLRLLAAANFVVDLAGPTSVGKTSTLRVAASAWGDPSGTGASLLGTWNSTVVFRDRAPAVLQGLPVFADDTKVAGDAAGVSRTVYALVQGVGRGRGTVGGVAASATFETVMLSTGEQPIVGLAKDGGLRGRVVTLAAPPFGAVGAGTALAVRDLTDRARAHHGHAGPALVQFLLDHPDRYDAWRHEHRAFAASYRQRAAGNNLLDRLAEPLAAVAVASKVAHEALGFTWDWADPVPGVWADLAGPAATDAAAEAFIAAYNAAVANRARFEPVFKQIKHHEMPVRSFTSKADLRKAVEDGFDTYRKRLAGKSDKEPRLAA